MTLTQIKEIVRLDSKQRYDLILENTEGLKVEVDHNATSSDAVDGVWWIKARQGHSIKVRYRLHFIKGQLLTVFTPLKDNPT